MSLRDCNSNIETFTDLIALKLLCILCQTLIQESVHALSNQSLNSDAESDAARELTLF